MASSLSPLVLWLTWTTASVGLALALGTWRGRLLAQQAPIPQVILIDADLACHGRRPHRRKMGAPGGV